MRSSRSFCARVAEQSVGALVRLRLRIECYRSARSVTAQDVLEARTVQWSMASYKEEYRMPPGITRGLRKRSRNETCGKSACWVVSLLAPQKASRRVGRPSLEQKGL